MIVMSRPRSVDDYKGFFTNVFEVTGFRRIDIETSLLRLENTSVRTSIEDYFDNNPNVKKMCYLPLHMTMIIYLASLRENPLSKMNSETKIFKSFLHLTIAHYQKQHGLDALILDNCFRHKSEKDSLCSLFISICELAFNATLHHQQTFSSNEIQTLSVSTDILQKVSFFNIKKENQQLGHVIVFSFSHQTFRDFMSAYHLILLPIAEQERMIEKYANESTFRDLVWKFYFGLLGEQNNDTALFSLFQSYVKYGGYEQLPTNYYEVDLYPLAYAFETGIQHSTFVNLLDSAKIVGTGNNYSLQLNIKEPMEVRSFLNIEENVNANVNFLFMKHTLEWTIVRFIKIQLQIQPNLNPDPNVCSSSFWVQTNKTIINGKSLNSYCNQTYMTVINYSSVVILELEYFHPIKEAVNPQVVFNMLRSAVATESLLAIHIRYKMLHHLLDTRQKSSLRNKVILGIIFSNHSYSSENLTNEELVFLHFWNYYDKYVTIFSYRQYSFNFSELKKFKIQQSLSDFDLMELCFVLKSATKLEVLDLSSNLLHEPTALLDLFKSIPHLKVLQLSNNLLNLNWLAKGFKYLNNLQELNMSGNIFNIKDELIIQNKTFGSQLRNLKKLEILDLSWILYKDITNLTTGLKSLTNLKQLYMSYCMINNSHIGKFAKSLFSLNKLKHLDMSHNLIDMFSSTFAVAVNLVEEVNLSHNLIMIPVSTLGILLTLPEAKLRHINLSNNSLCGDDYEFQSFLIRFWESNLHKIDLSNNTFYFYNEVNHTLKISEYHGTPAKTVYVQNSILIKNYAVGKYARCICKYAGIKKNYRQKCLNVSKVLKKSNTTKEELDFIHDNILYLSLDRLQIFDQYEVMADDRALTMKRSFALGRFINPDFEKNHTSKFN